MKRGQGNRGKWFETAIEVVNRSYKLKNIANIEKIPTPISYNTRTGKARFEKKSTVDFTGCVKGGRYVAFDTKEVSTQTLPFKNVHDHQVDYMTNIQRMGGTAFLLVFFRHSNECFKLSIDQYNDFKSTADRKSIPYDWFSKHAVRVKSANGVAFDYLSDVLIPQSIN